MTAQMKPSRLIIDQFLLSGHTAPFPPLRRAGGARASIPEPGDLPDPWVRACKDRRHSSAPGLDGYFGWWLRQPWSASVADCQHSFVRRVSFSGALVIARTGCKRSRTRSAAIDWSTTGRSMFDPRTGTTADPWSGFPYRLGRSTARSRAWSRHRSGSWWRSEGWNQLAFFQAGHHPARELPGTRLIAESVNGRDFFTDFLVRVPDQSWRRLNRP